MLSVMSPPVARWLAPAGAALAVLVAVVVPGVLGQPSSGGAGPRPDPQPDRLVRQVRPVVPDPRPGDRRDSGSTREILVTGYRSSGRDLTVFYRVAPRSDCSTGLRRPRVTETSDSVAVRLERAVPARPGEACGGRRLRASVRIRLDGPVGERVVQDAARRGALIPLEQPDIKAS
jgi:hypothetical protein